MDHASLISKRSAAVNASGIRKVFDLAADLKDPINLSIGQPDFDVPDAIKSAAVEAIQAGFNRYTQTQGTGELREALAARLATRPGWEKPSVLVTSGVSGGLMLAFMALLDAGDEVIVPDPYFVMYKHLVRLVGAKPVFVDTYPDFRLDAARVEAAITERTKLILVNSPANPTGKVASADDLRAVLEVARRRGVLALSDEIYDEFNYDGDFVSAATLAGPDELILLGGFSKTYGMTGWRMGYAAGPRRIVEEMTKLQQYTFVCAPSMVQAAGLEALRTDMSGHIAAYGRKRDLIYEALRKDFDVERPGGAFYIFPAAPGGSATAFVAKAIANNVLIIPGSVFSERDTHFRISFATTEAKLAEGAAVLCRLAREMKSGG
ncbi:MAG: putative N-acetyl-LL-diaminopimelate aminotransferase [Phycisphaerae bacterium]|nr:putative N-acetyl-LL-diaminopimelate aminotransferase [Phycisphaerae bacterium]